MRFKSLQIQGFKSFVEKTVVDFPPGITAIVGPNGSGKSNIMDALRWVFGEQRASELRGGEMEDVIFAGSEKRRPAGFAEVALTMSDLPVEVSAKWGTFSEITVSRKIYRTGEREYFINGRRCRLKDVRDIFFDTGLGARSISIIEQERVTKIVNSTPEELRYFLEETAGVIRYKERKKDAEQRLRQAHDNLSRINDILSVMAADMERLNAQAEQVRRYRELKAKREEFEKAFICATYGKLLRDKEQFEAAVAAHRSEMAVLVTENQARIELEMTIQKELDLSREKLKELRKLYDLAKETLNKAESDIARISSSLELAGKQQAQIAEDLEKSKLRKKEISERLEDIETALDETKELCEEFSDQVREHTDAVSEYKSMAERTQDGLKQLNRRYLDVTQQFTGCTNKINLKQAESSNHRATAVRLKREQEELSAESSTVVSRLEKGKADLAMLESSLSGLKKITAAVFNAVQARERELTDFQKGRYAKEVTLKTAENQIEFLHKEINTKIAGGAKGRELIERLSGRPYVELVEAGDENFLLHSDIIVFPEQSKDTVLEEVSRIDFSLRFIFDSGLPALSDSADTVKVGENLYRQGAVYRKVGGDDHRMVLIGLRQRLREEEERRDVLAAELNGADEILAVMQAETDTLRKEYQEKSGAIKAAELDYSGILTNVAHFEEQKQRMGRNLGVVDKEIALALDGAELAEKEAESLRSKREELAEKQSELDEERVILEGKLESLNEMLEDKREEHASASRELARYSERKNALEAENTQLEKDINSIISSIESLSGRMERLTEVQAVEWKRERDAAAEKKTEASKQAIALSGDIAEAERNQIVSENGLAELRTALNDINNTLHEIDKKLSDQLGKSENARLNMDALAQQMFESWGEDIADTWSGYAGKVSGSRKIQDDITAVNTEIDALGPLNMAAEDELAVKDKQYREQSAQQHDIEKSIDNLQGLIGEIDDSTVQLFRETFDAVRENFTAVFARFFAGGEDSGGYAELRLTEPENLLVTGVELSLTPPGKKISNKNLLSGGEKALAAMTLLFALFLQKPTPFCFLDEVDAPLDDANAARFITMVRSMAAATQFVIITHKHQTMAAADSLYGVTMQEGGVSSMLSVELKDSDRK